MPREFSVPSGIPHSDIHQLLQGQIVALILHGMGVHQKLFSVQTMYEDTVHWELSYHTLLCINCLGKAYCIKSKADI